MRPLRLLGCCFHRLQRLAKRRAQYAAFGDDGGDVLGRGHVEGGIADAYAVGRELLAAVVGDFNAGRSSMGMASPVAVAMSMVDQGAAT